MQNKRRVLLLVLLVVLAVFGSVQAQDDLPAAEIENDEGGVTQLTGSLIITNQNVKDSSVQPVVLLEDQAGFIDRDRTFLATEESQVIGNFVNDYYLTPLEEPIIYHINLPLAPQGEPRDVDQDGDEDAGVQVYQVALWDNINGEIFLDRVDYGGYGGWTAAYGSAEVTQNPATYLEYIGGRIVVWAPDDGQGFPSGFGDDGMLFTEDDPIVSIPAGYTLVDMETDPFTFDRSSSVTMDLLEPESFSPDDYSEMSYTEAFDAFIAKAENEYAFNVLGTVDWQELSEEYRPRVEEAEANEDAEAFALAICDLATEIPDGHIAVFSYEGATPCDQRQAEAIAGGIGISVRELDDGRILVNFVLEGGPAAEAGIEYGAEIIEFDGMPVDEAISAQTGVNAPYSLASTQRLDQLRDLIRMPLGTEVEVTFANPGGEEETVTLTATDERNSLAFSRQFVYGIASTSGAPIEYEFLPSGYGYVRVNSFSNDIDLLFINWDYFIRTAVTNGVPGIIVDLRTNGGGFSYAALRMASSFFTEEIPVYYREDYNPDIDAFFSEPEYPSLIIPPTDPDLIYTGPVTVLIGPGCASACEYFAYAFGQNDRAQFVGQYATNGIAGGWFDTYLPDGLVFALPTSQGRGVDGDIIIEGIGIQPTIDVPVTEENMATTIAEQDVVLDAAIAYLDDVNTPDVTYTDGGEIALGDSVDGTIGAGERVQYAFTLEDDATVDIILSDESGALDTYLRIYDTEGNLLIENDDAESGGTVNSALTELEIPGGFALIIEVGTYEDASEGDYNLSITETEG
jgi:C-terminal processing protease CtpA/Prc